MVSVSCAGITVPLTAVATEGQKNSNPAMPTQLSGLTLQRPLRSLSKGVWFSALLLIASSRIVQGGTLPLVPFNQPWRYNQNGTNLTGVYQAPGFVDATWPSGPGLLGFESVNPYPYPVLTTLTTNTSRITFYFRTHFQCPVNPAGMWLVFSNYVDDGLVLHLNGAELYRVRMNPGAYNHLTTANSSAVEGQAVVFTLPVTNLLQGDNVLAAEVHQVTADSSDVMFGLAVGLTDLPLLPDLVLWGPAVAPSFQVKTFAPDSCEINEGCGSLGERRLMRFATETRNLGTADLFLGNPVGNPQFHYDPCHQHYHFAGFAAYRLRDSNEVIVATGHKVGFCLLDGLQWNPAASPTMKYNCGYQGIQWGWADTYGANLDCQFVDITGIPAGRYILELETDPDNRIMELNETNNITRVSVDIPEPCSVPPTNDLFAAAQTIGPRSASVFFRTECAGREQREPRHASNDEGGHSMWFQWTPNYSGTAVFDTVGSGFDTLLAVYRGTILTSLTLVGSDDDSGGNLTSRLAATVTSGTTYRIAVDGWGGASGAGVLSINPSGNDAFASCVSIAGLSGSIGGSTTTASREAGEPAHAGIAGERSIWYCWTPPAAGRYFFNTDGSRFNTLLAVYTGNSVGALTLVAGNDDGGAFGASKVLFDAQTNTTYRIAIDGRPGDAGLTLLNWRPEVRFAAFQREGPALQMTLSGAPGDEYLVYTSPDLVHWTPWQNVTNLTGLLPLTDSVTVGGERRFYWARLLQ